MEKLGPHLLSVTQETEWPGTRLFDDTATVHRFSFNFETAQILKDAAGRLYDWIQPHLPEDLSILRHDGSPWLVTITHERYSSVYLNDAEYQEFGQNAPTLIKSLRSD